MPANAELNQQRRARRRQQVGSYVNRGAPSDMAAQIAAARQAPHVPGGGSAGQQIAKQPVSRGSSADEYHVGGWNQQPNGQGPGLGQNAQAGLGAQLSGRVASGAIDQGQAEHTAKERATLESAYGSDWRTKVYGDPGYVKRVRDAMTKEPGNPQVKALYEQLMGQRKQMLEQAKTKLAG